jgi:predicted nucleic acid-binding protein
VIVVDTSVWVGVLLESDLHHQLSRSWYAGWSIEELPVHLPTLLLAELAGVLRRRGTPSFDIAEILEEIVEREAVDLHSLDRQAARSASTIAATTGLKGADAVFVALAATLDVPLVSWDQQQRERGAYFCRTMTPVEAMELTG